MTWLAYALLSAFAAALTAILSTLGVADVPATLATAVRTVVVAAIAWGLVAATGDQRGLPAITPKSLIFLVFSGIATAVSWLAYFHALRLAPASWVAPIDKLSLPLTIVLAVVVLREPLSWQLTLGVVLMMLGAAVTRLQRRNLTCLVVRGSGERARQRNGLAALTVAGSPSRNIRYRQDHPSSPG